MSKDDKTRKFIVSQCFRASAAPTEKGIKVAITFAGPSGLVTETEIPLDDAATLGMYLKKLSNLGAEVDAKVGEKGHEIYLEVSHGVPVARIIIEDVQVAWLLTNVMCTYLGPWVLEVVKEQQVKDEPKPA